MTMIEALSIEKVSAAISILVAAISTASFVTEKRKRKSEIKEHQRQIWNNISKVRGLMSDLEKQLSQDGVDYGKHQAVGKLTFMFRDLAAQAISIEENPTIDTIKAWRNAGKIASDWQEACFINCLLTNELLKPDQTTNIVCRSDELPPDHPISAKCEPNSSPAINPTTHPEVDNQKTQ